jgi:hypothetical protein
MNPFNELKISDLRKDENRVLNFINKIKNGKSFSTVNKKEVIIKKSSLADVNEFMMADNKMPKSGTSIYVDTSKGKLKIPNDFLKTGEFGGRGAGSGTNAETAAMNYFNEELNKILKKENVSQIILNINGRKVNCAIMAKTEGKWKGREPKSDMTIKDITGKAVAFISHKAGRTAKDYQQYGGVSDKALPSTYTNKKFIKKFMQDVNKLRPDGLNSGNSFYRTITDKKLIQIMMYGPEFGLPASIHNIDEFHLGNMNLKGRGKGPYNITSVHKGDNGYIPKDQFEAVLFIRFQNNRGDARAAGEIVKNARIGVFPKAKISSTTKKI